MIHVKELLFFRLIICNANEILHWVFRILLSNKIKWEWLTLDRYFLASITNTNLLKNTMILSTDKSQSSSTKLLNANMLSYKKHFLNLTLTFHSFLKTPAKNNICWSHKTLTTVICRFAQILNCIFFSFNLLPTHLKQK